MERRSDAQLVSVRGLSTAFLYDGKPVPVTSDVSFDIRQGEILGLVGESGSGKSVTAKTILRLLPSPPSSVLAGEILYRGDDLLRLSEDGMLRIRGNKISMIFQEPMTSLNPVFTCGDQIVEAILLHQKCGRHAAEKQAADMLKNVGMSMPLSRLKQYPHELSGGMRQRVMIAMALSCNPELLIADEPTTALDPTIQAQILRLIRSLRDKIGMSVLYITHDLGVVAQICDRVAVMYAGQIMEEADVRTLFGDPRHPYTQGLLRAMPRVDRKQETLYNIPGIVPHITRMPRGCRFHPRCPHATERCREEAPAFTMVTPDHGARCFLAQNPDETRKEG